MTPDLLDRSQLPLYLAGGDSVVQCWQFGQTIQGQGLHDHLRNQYRLPAAGDRVASLRISPCGEQFSSIDTNGFLCLWRFGGADMTMPFCKLDCQVRRGADLTYVGTSALLASVGLANANSSSLSLWDVLLPPSQAQVASCHFIF